MHAHIYTYMYVYRAFANYKDIKDTCKPDRIGWSTSYCWSISRMYSPYGPWFGAAGTRKQQLYVYLYIYIYSVCVCVCHGIFRIVGKFYPQFAHTCQQATMDKNWWCSPFKIIQKGHDCITDLVISTILDPSKDPSSRISMIKILASEIHVSQNPSSWWNPPVESQAKLPGFQLFPAGLELEEFQLVDGLADPQQIAFILQLEREIHGWESSRIIPCTAKTTTRELSQGLLGRKKVPLI